MKEKIGSVTYTLILRGNTVVSIDPPGKNGPLYRDRGQHSKNHAQWHEVRRFVPEEQIYW